MLTETYSLPKANQPLFLTSPPSIHHLTDNEIAQAAPFDPSDPMARWLRFLLSPLKKLWLRLHSAHREKRGLYILYEDVKSCQCEDVHILWSILVESHSPRLRLKR